MKHLLSLLLLAVGISAQAQIAELKISPNVISTDKNGGVIEKGDTIVLNLMFKNNGSHLRNFYLDFQHQISAINFIGVGFPTAGSQGASLPTGATTSTTNNYYPGYYWLDNQNNNTEDGLMNAQYASYGYAQGGTKAINRININTATPNGNVTDLNDGLLAQLLFKVTTVQAGFAYDSIYYNFAYGWDNGGNVKTITMPKPNSTWVTLDPATNALIKGTFQTNANLTTGYHPMLAIIDSATSQVKSWPAIRQDGSFYVGSEVLPNTTYYALAFLPSDTLPATLNRAITVSDYTAAQTEFNKQNLDGTFTNASMKTGMGYFAADLNRNGKFDGGDLTLLFAQAVGADTVVNPQAGSNTTSIPTFTKAFFDTATSATTLALPLDWTSHKVKFKTDTTAINLDLKYVIPGDINRSHSSQVVMNGQIQSNSVTENRIKSFATAVNTVNTATPVIEVSLNNTTVTSNSIEIPFTTDALGNKISALQFEVVYDPTKIKFEEIKSFLPNTWFVFANSTEGKVRFGAIDKDLKSPYGGIAVPFTLKFSSIGAGVDLNTKIKVTSNLDASDDKGTQLGINLNTTTIKLTGYNNF
jgi:hypothetical protein